MNYLVKSRALEDAGTRMTESQLWRKAFQIVKKGEKEQKGARMIKSAWSLKAFKDNFKGLWRNLNEAHGNDLSSYDQFCSAPEHLEVRGNDREVLVYRMRVHMDLVDRMERSTAALPAPKPAHGGSCPTSHGQHTARYYAYWADYAKDSLPFLNRDFKWESARHIGVAEKWIDKYSRLLHILADKHWLLDPNSYARAVGVGKRLKVKLNRAPFFHCWFTVAINQGMEGVDASKPHSDRKGTGLTCLVPYGNFTSGILVLG